MTAVQNFNLRVYGLLIHQGQVLITHEHRGGMDMTKFPGGGLEKGEGLADGLIREFREELGVEIDVEAFFYVNDFLQISAFNPKDQLLSFYYLVSAGTTALAAIEQQVKKQTDREEQAFEWMLPEQLHRDLFTFPIDKVVADKLKGLAFK